MGQYKRIKKEKDRGIVDFAMIQNEDVEKQDCEINAAKRLLKRLKEEYKRLPICLQEDALYATGPMMRICRENGWKYIFTQLDTRQKAVGESYTWILEGGGERYHNG